MERKLNRNLIVGIVRNARYIPSIVSTIRNWPTYFLYYLGIKKGGAAYFFRNGITLRDREGTASGTIAVVFIRKQYGSIVGKSTIVEIGANVGTFAIYAAAADPSVRIYSYEPIPENYEVLINNITENGFEDRVKAFNLGVAGTSGKREFYFLASSPEHSFIKADGSSRSVTVDCLSLIDVLNSNSLAKVDLLKINAEGAEYEILYSAPKECFDRIDEIRMEYHDGKNIEKHDLGHLKGFLEQSGYVTTHLYQHTTDEGFIWLKKRQ
jgi:FkbM family methyltransferase